MAETATNRQMDGAFIRDRTIHLVRERDGRKVETECGIDLNVSERFIKPLDDTNTDSRHLCGRCPWDSVGSDGGDE